MLRTARTTRTLMEALSARGLTAGLLLVLSLPAQNPALGELHRSAVRSGIRTGLCVATLDGEICFAGDADRFLIPASNQKLLTVAGACASLGVDYRFRTAFRLRGGVLEVLAGADPNWRTGGTHDPVVLFRRVAEELRAAGVERIHDIRLLEEPFGGPRRPAGWPKDQLNRRYAAPTGGLVLDAGCFRARVAPGADDRARIEVLAPPGGVPVQGTIRLSDRRKGGSVFSLDARDGYLQARGRYYRKGRGTTVEAAQWDPSWHYRRALQDALFQAGIGIDAYAPAAPDRDLMVYESPLVDALGDTLRDSSNFHAEQILRALGAEREGDGSLVAGARSLRGALDAWLGGLPDELEIVDGSGLSRGNQVSARFLVELLVRVAREPFAQEVLSALPQSARDGTLKRRFRNSPLAGRVRAKTGTINGVSALSGVVRCDDGQTRVFSILMNYPPKGSKGRPNPRRLQERMVEAIAGIEN